MSRLATPLILSLLAACGGASEPAEGALLNRDLEGEPVSEIEEEPGPDGLVLRLLDLGDEPRRELRYERRAGADEEGRIELMMSVAAAGEDGTQGAHQTAPVRLTFEVGPTELVESHMVRYRIRAEAVQVGLPPETPREVLDQIARETDPLRAIDVTYLVDDRGIVHEIVGEVPADLDPHTRSLLANIRMSLLSPVLPSQPIGEGAAWEVKHVVDHDDFEAEQIASYELVAMEEHTGRLQVSLRQHAAPTALANGDELRHYQTIGGGYIEMDLRHLVPEAQITGRTHVEAAVRSDDARIIPAQSEMSVAIRVEPVR